MLFTDTHTHTYLSEFDTDRKEVVVNAIQTGITKSFLPNIDTGSIPSLFKLCNQFPENCFPMMGLHPCSVKETYQRELRVVEHWLKREKIYAVGEIGIDLHWDKTYLAQQKDAFERQIVLAKKHTLPIVIHTRNSFTEVFEIVKQQNTKSLKGIFHCFSGNIEEAKQIISLRNFKMGIGGVVTFKNSGLDKVVKEIDLKHLVLETDAPYLAPVPYRGKRNESKYLILIAQKIAELKNISIEKVAEATTNNAKEIFGF